MGSFSAGSVVFVPFPFSDLSKAKRRPAVVLASVDRGDWVLCQITSKSYSDARAIILTDKDFETGSLQLVSYARPGKLFTANESLFIFEAGILKTSALKKITNAVGDIFR